MHKFNFTKYLIFLNTIVLFQINLIRSAELKDEKFKDLNSNITTQTEYSEIEYILDTGDQLFIEFNKFDLFNGYYNIDQDGNLNLPEIGLIFAKNKTISELKKFLLDKYNEFIFDPEIRIFLTEARPVNVTLRGEVNTTGLFNLNYLSNKAIGTENSNSSSLSNTSVRKNARRLSGVAPKLFDLIQKGEGITSNADLSKIIVLRNNPLKNGGGKVKTEINLFNLIQNGDQSQNIILRDGDDVFVSRSEKILIDQVLALTSSNITPNVVNVFINGNVSRTGASRLPAGVSLFEAIFASGEKPQTGNIEFIRLNRKGITEKRIISFNKQSVKGSPNNPILVNGDIIYVRKNIFGQTTSAIRNYSSPFLKGYGLYKIFN